MRSSGMPWKLVANPLLFLAAGAFLSLPWLIGLDDFLLMKRLHPELFEFLKGDRTACLRMLEVLREYRTVRLEPAFQEKPVVLPEWRLFGDVRVRGAFRGWGLDHPPRNLNEQRRVIDEHPLISLVDREIYPFARNYDRGARIWVYTLISPGTFFPADLEYHLEVRGVSSRVRQAIYEVVLALWNAQDEVSARRLKRAFQHRSPGKHLLRSE